MTNAAQSVQPHSWTLNIKDSRADIRKTQSMTELTTPHSWPTKCKKPLVYVAGPYQFPDPVENTHKTCKIATELYESGLVTPVVPHLSLLWHIITPRPVRFWLDYDLELLAHCDALLRLEGKSAGADEEVSFASGRGIPVFYSVEGLKAWARR